VFRSGPSRSGRLSLHLLRFDGSINLGQHWRAHVVADVARARSSVFTVADKNKTSSKTDRVIRHACTLANRRVATWCATNATIPRLDVLARLTRRALGVRQR
jgi:hypothetical protein